MNAFAYYVLVMAVGLLVLTPLTWAALGNRRATALAYRPVSMAWELADFSDLKQDSMRMYRLHPSSAARDATREIRDDTGKRIGRISTFRYEPAEIEIGGAKFRVFDQASKVGALWRGRVGGESDRSVVLQSAGKPVVEICRSKGFFRRAWSSLRFKRGQVDIVASKGRLHRPFELTHANQTLARVVRPDPTGLAPITYVAVSARADKEFVAGVLYLASLRH